jgi:dipeptidyl aminopeptidase/acylaminoacyl peptidase
VVLCYPVISADKKNCPHVDSFLNLTGKKEISEKDIDDWSLERHVDEKSAPAFIIHTAEDELVPVRNALAISRAYADAGVQFEMHIYPHGPHGFALGNKLTDPNHDGRWSDEKYARWIDDSIYFFEHLK